MVTVTSAVVVAAVVLALWPTGGTLAALDARATTGTTSPITSGTADLTVGTLSMPSTPLWPGATVRGSVAVRNTGDVPLALSVLVARAASTTTTPAAASVPLPGLVARLGVSDSAATCQSGISQPTWTGAVGSPSADAGIEVQPGSSTVLCLALTLPSNATTAVQGQHTGFTMTITGTQV